MQKWSSLWIRHEAYESKHRYSTLRQEKNAIRHEDLLVYLGHLQGQFEAAQKEVESLKMSAVNSAMRSRAESVESTMNDMELGHALNSQPKQSNSNDRVLRLNWCCNVIAC